MPLLLLLVVAALQLLWLVTLQSKHVVLLHSLSHSCGVSEVVVGVVVLARKTSSHLSRTLDGWMDGWID